MLASNTPTIHIELGRRWKVLAHRRGCKQERGVSYTETALFQSAGFCSTFISLIIAAVLASN